LAEDVSIEMANIVFDKAARKVIKGVIKHVRLVSLLAGAKAQHLLYYSQALKQMIKPSQAHDIYLTKEQQLQRKVDWIIKDSEALDAMCEWWASMEFRATSERNRHNRQSKASVHHYGADGHVRKTRIWYDTLFLSFRKFFILTCL
jgi:hypothetical protein